MQQPVKYILGLLIVLAMILPSVAQQPIKDTNFILREVHTYHDHTIYHAVFIDNRKASPYYKKILNFRFAAQAPPIYITGKPNDSERDIQIDKDALKEIPKNWCPLELYKGRYYVFTRNFTKISINDSTMIVMGMEGPDARKLYSLKKIMSHTFKIKVAAHPKTIQTITIHIVDPKRQMAVFEYRTPKNKYVRYELMIGAKKVRSFPIIVDYSPDVKPQVFMFDEPDFQKLLKDNK